MDVYEVEFRINGNQYIMEFSEPYGASRLILDLESKNILVTSVRKNGVAQ